MSGIKGKKAVILTAYTFYAIFESIIFAKEDIGFTPISFETTFPSLNKITAVSYTHLDVYKRQKLKHCHF